MHIRSHVAGLVSLGWAAVFVIAALPGVSCAETSITIALSSHNMGLAPIRYAVAEGLLKKRGINANIVTMDSGNATMAAIISGSAQVGAPGLSEAIIARARGQKVVVIANITRGLSMELVVSKAVADKAGVKPDAPLAERLKVLQGINVALPSATSPSVAAFKGAASSVGVTFNNVYMSQSAMVPALETGAIDAMVAGPPMWLPPIASGKAYMWVSAPRGDIPEKYNTASSACLQSTEEYTKAHPEVVKGLRDAMVEFADIVVKNPKSVEDWFKVEYPQVDSQSIKLIVTELRPAWQHPMITADDMKNEIEILKQVGLNVPGIDKVDPKSIVEF